MRAPTPTRAPSPCSISSVSIRNEDLVSLSGIEHDNDPTCTSGSGLRTLVPSEDNDQEGCTPGDGIMSRMSITKQQPDLENEKVPIEEPKPIWTKSRKTALRYFLIIHLLPVGITLVLFWLYLRGLQWRANDIQLKALLFAAKLHESLIVLSLGDILFHRIRYHLLTGRGISFGLLVSPFRVPNPLSLFQTPFLASAKFTLKSGPELVTVLLIVLVSVLALLAAPSSGALMLPRYDWWQIPNDEEIMANFRKHDQDDATYIGAAFEDLFPLVIDGRFGPDSVRDNRLETINFSDRFEHLVSGLDRILVDGSSGVNTNITVVDGTTADSFTLVYQDKSLDDCEVMTCQNISKTRNTTVAEVSAAGIDCLNILCQSIIAQATSPLAIVTEKLFDRYRTSMSVSSSVFMMTAQPLDSKRGTLTWRQPSVSMQCSTVLLADELSSVSFQHWGRSSPFSISLDAPLLAQIKQLKGYSSTTYVDVSHLLPAGVTASTALLMRSSLIFDETTYLCLVDARWIESQVWFTGPYATIMRSGTSMNSVQATTGPDIATTTSPVINITTEYGNSLDANLTVASTYKINPGDPVKASPFEYIQQYCGIPRFGRFAPLGTKCAMLAHTLYLTDSLRRTQSFFRYRTAKQLREAKDLSLLDADNWTKLDYRLYHQLHAYKFEGLIVKLSMTVLLVHIMLVHTHLLLLTLGDGWCSRAWSELGELMALAMLTRPSPLLQNAGGGVTNWQTWRLRTFVREVASEGRLELVLKETVGSPRALVDLEDGQEKALVEPEANRRKYKRTMESVGAIASVSQLLSCSFSASKLLLHLVKDIEAATGAHRHEVDDIRQLELLIKAIVRTPKGFSGAWQAVLAPTVIQVAAVTEGSRE